MGNIGSHVDLTSGWRRHQGMLQRPSVSQGFNALGSGDRAKGISPLLRLLNTAASGRILEKCSWVRISFHYSWRRATIGSTRLARSAGMHAAASETKSRMSGAAVKVSG